jgi:anaerobic selenocysteine-containing dehydrogenase
MQIFRYAEEGSIRFLWISGTNPAVSMPELSRIRSILGQDRLFVVVTDAFLTETAALADVVLPAALWGEKTGTYTNHDRTVHLSERAVDPPGQARTDMEIFLDYAARLDLRDRDGQPLISWRTTEACFDAFKAATRGRPCDYTGLTYDKLRGSAGIQWPCNEEHPDGTERLYADLRFPTSADQCEDYGHDLETGAAFERKDRADMKADGRAVLKAAEYSSPQELPNEDFPLALTTGRTVYHFHTRTKTGRSPELAAAAPGPWVELNPDDAGRIGIEEGDLVRIESARGHVVVRARLTGIRCGVAFMPFHYGYWDRRVADGEPSDDLGSPTAANELTMTAWDPVSKQPILKVAAAVRVARLASGDGSSSPPTTSAPAAPSEESA